MKKFIFLFTLIFHLTIKIYAQHLDSTFWRVDGNVYAMEKQGDTIYMGGDFTHIGPPVFNLTRIDSITGIPDPNFPQPQGTCHVISDDRGGYVIANSTLGFYGDTSLPYQLSRVDANGNSMLNWPPSWPMYSHTNFTGPNLIYGNKAYITGSFNTIGQPSSPGTLIDTSSQVLWQIPQTNGVIKWSSPDGNGGLFIGGTFTSVGNSARNGFAEIDASGNLSAWAPNFIGQVDCALRIGNVVFVGGAFTQVNNLIVTALARIDAITGQPLQSWTTTIGGLNAEVYSLDTSGTTLYMAGAFSTINQLSRTDVGAIDYLTGNILSWSVSLNGTANSIHVYGGYVFIAGSFTTVNSQSRSYIARVDLVGTLTSWNMYANAKVLGMSFGSTNMYVWGNFTTVGSGSQIRRYAAAVNPSTAAISNWNLNIPSGPVGAIPIVAGLIEIGNKVFVGGNFTQINSQTQRFVASVTTSGTLLSFGFSVSSNVRSISNLGNGKLFFAGDYFSINAPQHIGLAQADMNTGLITGWTTDVITGIPAKILPYQSNVIIVGTFTSINSTSRNYIAEVDTTLGQLTSFYPNINGSITDGWVDDSLLYFVGTFTQVNSTARNGIAAINLNTGLLSGFNPSVSGGSITCMAFTNSHIIFGGTFSQVDLQTRTDIAIYDKSSGALNTLWSPVLDGGVHNIIISGSLIFISGAFHNVNGIPRICFASLSDSTASIGSLDVSLGSGVTGNSVTLGKQSHYLIIAGSFGSVGYMPCQSLTAFRISTGLPLPWQDGVDKTIYTLKLSGNRLYAGGNFNTAGGQSIKKIAAFDPISGAVIPSFTPQPDSTVNAILSLNNSLLIGGAFSMINSQSSPFLARVDLSGQLLSFNATPNNSVRCLAKQGQRIFIGGDFTQVSTQARNRIAALDTTGNITTWNPNANNVVDDIVPSGTIIYVAGKFTNIGGAFNKSISALDGTTGLATAWQIGNVAVNTENRSVLLDQGVVYIGGNFTSMGNQVTNFICASDRWVGTVIPWLPGLGGSALSVYDLIMTSRGLFASGTIRGASLNPSSGFVLISPERQNIISGNVFKDLDHDSIFDGLDYPAANTHVTISPSGSFSIANSAGNYSFAVDTGSFSYSSSLLFPCYSSVPSVYQSSFSTITQLDSANDFALQTVDSTHELEINLIYGGTARIGYPARFILKWINNGTVIENPNITFHLDSAFAVDSVSLAPQLTASDSMVWNPGPILPGQSQIVTVYTTLHICSHIWQHTHFSARIEPVQNDSIPSNNFCIYDGMVLASHDSNIKIVQPTDSIISPNFGPLTYSVHFQNTGNDTALIVVVRDTINTNLDLSTLTIIGASHSYSAAVDQRVLTVTFDNILLPDSTTNEIGSQGFFTYRISPYPNLPSGTVIDNSAGIYFDYNDPIITNTTSTMIDFINPVFDNSEKTTFSFDVMPNPATESALLQIPASSHGPFRMEIMDITGKIIFSEKFTDNLISLHLNDASPGIYLIRIIDSEEHRAYRKLIVEH